VRRCPDSNALYDELQTGKTSKEGRQATDQAMFSDLSKRTNRVKKKKLREVRRGTEGKVTMDRGSNMQAFECGVGSKQQKHIDYRRGPTAP